MGQDQPEIKTNTYYVSVLVRNPSDHCDPDQRIGWFFTLLKAKLPLTLFVDPFYKQAIQTHPSWTTLNYPALTLEDWTLQKSATWKTYRGNVKLPAHRNQPKDTVYFMLLMNAKSELLDLVAKRNPGFPFMAFIDAGITKIFKKVDESLHRLQTCQIKEDVSGVLIPGCWPPREFSFEDLASRINWTYCGGFFVLPFTQVNAFFESNMKTLKEFISKGYLTWEVNIWVHMVKDSTTPPLLWFPSDHDDRMTMIPSKYLRTPLEINAQPH